MPGQEHGNSIADLLRVPAEVVAIGDDPDGRRGHLIRRVHATLGANSGLIAFHNGDNVLRSTIHLENGHDRDGELLRETCLLKTPPALPHLLVSVIETRPDFFDCLALTRHARVFEKHERDMVRELHAICSIYYTTPPVYENLTPRQREVMRHLVEGATENEIAAALCVSSHTVHSHVKAIYRELDVHNRVELVQRTAERLPR